MVLLLPIIALLCAPALWLAIGRPRYLEKAGDGAPATKLSVVIPARDEEENIGGLLESISGQGCWPREVIVVDDHSTDDTAAVATEKAARVLPSKELPEGWKGKPWACQQGAEEATGKWLLFVDADVRFGEGAMGAFERLTKTPGVVYSVCPYHKIKSPYEELSAFFNLVMVSGIDAFGLLGGSRPALFGQCMLISREDYFRVGGHGAVRGEVLENFHFSQHLEREGIARRSLLGGGLVGMRMFPGGLADLAAGWKKGFAAGAKHAPPRALALTSIWISGAMLALVSLALIPFFDLGPGYRALAWTAYGIYGLGFLFGLKMVGSFSWANALFFPLSLFYYQQLFFGSLVEKKLGIKTKWKGREVS